ncbi:hypothetical protein BH11ACT6_BH11ACT6_23590 [soil metagenome]
MQLAVRSSLMAGVAVVGVGVIAASPVAPTMPTIEVARAHTSAAVELSALVNPFQEYAVAFNVALQNIAALSERIAENPAPILSQILENQLRSFAGVVTFVGAIGESAAGPLSDIPAQLKLAVEQLAAGNVSTALNTVLYAALGPIVAPVIGLLSQPEVYAGIFNAIRQPIASLLAVIDVFSYDNVGNLLGPLLAPVQLLTDVTNAIGAAGDGIVSGVRNGDLEEVANALLSLGPDVTYALLNGSTGFGAGLLGSNGIVASLLTLRDLVAGALKPPAPVTPLAAAADVPAEAAATVTLAVSPAVEAAVTTEPAVVGTPSGEPGTGFAATVSEENTEAEATEAAEAAEATPEDVATPTEETEVPPADVESDSPAADIDTETGTDAETDADGDDDSSTTAPDSDAPAGPVRGNGKRPEAKSDKSRTHSGSSSSSTDSSSNGGSSDSGTE